MKFEEIEALNPQNFLFETSSSKSTKYNFSQNKRSTNTLLKFEESSSGHHGIHHNLHQQKYQNFLLIAPTT